MRRPAAAKPVVVHDLDQAVAVLTAARELGIPIAVWSVPAAAIRAGVGWFAAVERRARAGAGPIRARFVLDCADRADLVQEAFREGLKDVCFTGRAIVAERLADIASKFRARLYRRRPNALDLGHPVVPGAPFPAARLQRYLAGN